MKAAVDWCKQRWVWIAMVLPIVILGGVLFTTYALKFPFISSSHSAWASFGALLGGFFTLTSTLATVATLLFLARQNKGMQQVTQAQLAAMTFDRYINHRKLFIELLGEQEVSLGHRYKFRDPTLLYKAVFPANSPHNCDLSVSLSHSEGGRELSHVGRLYQQLEKLKALLAKAAVDDSDGFDLISALIVLRSDLLMVEQEAAPRDGDVKFYEKLQGFNIFEIDEFVKDVVKVSNLIFYFTNSPDVKVESFSLCSLSQKDYLLKGLYGAPPQAALKAYSGNRFLSDVVWLRTSLTKLADIDEFFSGSKQRLDQSLYSFSSVSRLKDDAVLKSLVTSCLGDVNAKFREIALSDHRQLIGDVQFRLDSIKSYL